MLNGIAMILFCFLVGIALAQYAFVHLFLRTLAMHAMPRNHQDHQESSHDSMESPPRGKRDVPSSEKEAAIDTMAWQDRWPKVAVILCVRGGDPFLAECLQAILNQDYPDYDLHIVVDSLSDPGWNIVQEVVQENPNHRVHIMPLEERLDTCSLKCSSLVQVLSHLDGSYRVIALVDTDTMTHRTWLRELVAPLADHRIGATTGNRWYMPLSEMKSPTDKDSHTRVDVVRVAETERKKFSWAGLMRYLWNMNAAIQMICFSIPWGGTLAIRREVFEKSDLLDKWSHAFCEDTMVYSLLRKLGLRIIFVPQLMMVNREDCQLIGLIQWIRRQLLAARLYHPLWWCPLVHGWVTSLAWLAIIGIGCWGLATSHDSATFWAAAGAGTYLAILMTYIPLIEAAVRRIVRQRGEPTHWMNWRFVLALPAAAFGLQMLYPAVLSSSLAVRRIRWRGVDYQIDGPWNVRMIEYKPYVMDSTKDAPHSL